MGKGIIIILSILIISCTSNDCLEISEKEYLEDKKAQKEYDLGNFQKAIEISNKSIENNPNNHIAYSNRATFLYSLCLEKGRLGQYNKQKIISDLEKSISLCPKFSKGYRNLIRLAYEFKDFDLVIKYTEEYNKKFKKTSELLTRLADACYEKERYKKGVSILNEAIDIEPIFNFAFVVRGKCFIKLNNYDKAINDLNEAIRRDSTFSLAYHERGFCYKKKEEYSLARRDYWKSLEVDSARIEPYFSLGTLEIEHGDTISGCGYYRLALKNYERDKNLVKSKRWEETINEVINTYCLE